MKRLSYLVLVTLLASSCQVSPSLAPAVPGPSAAYVAAPAYRSPMLPKVAIKPEAKVLIRGSQVRMEVRLPPVSASGGAFTTQQLDLASAAKITATIRDSYGKVYTPAGADGNGQVSYPANGLLSLNFSAVVPDQLLFAELQVSDGTADIPQADLAVVVKHTGISDLTTTMGFQSTPTAKTMKALLTADADRARALNLADLTAFMTSVTGITGTDPNFTYSCHPTLVDTDALATALRTQDPGALTPATYRRVGASVNLHVSGLVGSDTLEVQATDAASARKLAVANGDATISNATPGTGLKLLVGATAGNSTQYSFTVNPSTNLTLSNAAATDVNIQATPALAGITSLSPTSGAINTSVTLTGANFSTVAANNLVKFGSTLATVTAASATSLTVKVPAGISGSQPVTVTVGGQTSNSSPFDVTPMLSSLNVTSGLVNSSVTLTGTGFSSTAANNVVTFGGTTATVTAATATSLTVTVPTTAGTQSVTVTVGSQTSGGINYAVIPSLTILGQTAGIVDASLTLTGTGFSPTAADNAVSFGGTPATVVSATATSLIVTIPAGFGTRNVSVSVGGQTSGSLAHAVIPNIVSLSLPTGSSGDILDITGTGFDTTAANNTVQLGSATLTATSPSAGVLQVTVPNTPAGPANATVQVGAQTSAAASFILKPKLTSLSTAAGALSGKAALIRGQILTIMGSNFDPTPANNLVSFVMGATTITATAATATATQLTVTIPGTIDSVGDVTVSVAAHSQASNALPGVVPTVNVTINSSGFN